MPTASTRTQHSRAGLRDASGVTNAEWHILEARLPRPACGRWPAFGLRGQRWAWPQRRIINAILRMLRAGCA